jgi:hypothetical protein
MALSGTKDVAEEDEVGVVEEEDEEEEEEEDDDDEEEEEEEEEEENEPSNEGVVDFPFVNRRPTSVPILVSSFLTTLTLF